MVGFIKDGVRKLMDDDISNWEVTMTWILSAKNSLLMKSGYSSNQLMFGRNKNNSYRRH